MQKRDEDMEHAYAKQHGLDQLQVEFVHQPGEWVLMKQKRPGKMLSKAMGPYRFVQYTNDRGLVAELETVAGKKLQCSVANLLPLRPGVRPLQRWKSNRKVARGEQMWGSDSGSDAEYFSDSEQE